MTERSTLINMLLLAVLTGIYLTSGGIQCAVGCLTRIDDQPAKVIRVADCHYVTSRPQAVDSCLNKTCHQNGPGHGSLGGPVVTSLQKRVQPLANASQQPTPQFKAGSAYLAPLPDLSPKLAAADPTITSLSQQQRSLRTTVLLN